MKLHPGKRIAAWLLSAALLAGLPVTAQAAPADPSVPFAQVDNSQVSVSLLQQPEEGADAPPPCGEHDTVRVSIFLGDPPALAAGFDSRNIAENHRAMAYRRGLLEDQRHLVRRIEQAIRGSLDVVWNLTLAANIISANVEYGQIDRIAGVRGVEKVIVEKTYRPLAETASAEARPNMVISSGMTGVREVWDAGCYGAGTRIAVIDTGLDTDHQSFDPEALRYAWQQSAEREGVSKEAYIASLDLLDEEELAKTLPQLNLHSLMPDLTAHQLYNSLKVPFGVNYIDRSTDITHDNDSATAHGSHIAGIVSGNRFLPKDGSFVSAADTVYTLGNAPDAQLIVMKVFGADNPTDADYMAAIEDAVLLGCDVVNLSLGDPAPGGTVSPDYQDIMDALAGTDTVVSVAAGNAGHWADHASGPVHALYAGDAGTQTTGEPATFTNALAVASVDNNGTVSPSLVFQGRHMGYTDGKGSWHDPLVTLDPAGTGTEYECVMLTGEGSSADYEGIDVTGRIVLVPRGGTSFADKADTAAGFGAAATLICNNTAGSTGMVMEGYWSSAPCAMISRDDAALIRSGCTRQTTPDGRVYYTGTLTVDARLHPNETHPGHHTMSSFSSWGVPGDLSMKPELSAPGGSIYSVNGAVPETDQYTTMSGTSMAAPQVAGLSALLMEHIHRNQLSQPGLTDRALVQSLLMSTADPMHGADGRYIPVLQQGAGIANIRDAITAGAYILVDGQPDGKVKAELGDDPDRSGTCTLSFTLHSLSDRPQRFSLSADLFTQGTFMDYPSKQAQTGGDPSRMVPYLDTAVLELDSTVSWLADGRPVTQSAHGLAGCDFDGSGSITEQDAQALLDHVVQGSPILHEDRADLSGDGSVTTYDVHLFLSRLDTGTVTVPAHGAVTVQASMTLTDEARARLDADYPNGAYLQGYVYASGLPTREGVEGTQLNLPVLGFYGCWTDPSMFEVGSIQSKQSGAEPRTTYTGIGEAQKPVSYNTLEVEYARDPGRGYPLGGNPLDPAERPDPKRTAINSRNGDRLKSYVFTPIRNAAASRVQVTDMDGNVLWQSFPGPCAGAYYDAGAYYPAWLNTSCRYPIGFVPQTLEEGSCLRASVTLAPEYSVDPDTGSADWDTLGHGATLSADVRIDNTPPRILDVRTDADDPSVLTVTASDNQYIAGVALFDADGQTVLSRQGSIPGAQPGQPGAFTLHTQAAGDQALLVQVTDYACNTSTYALNAAPDSSVPADGPDSAPDTPAPARQPMMASGGVPAVSGALMGLPAAADSHADAPQDILVPVTADAASTNGLLRIGYDSSILELRAVSSSAELSAAAAQDGTVTFGYASGTAAIPAGSPVVTLTFGLKQDKAADVTITTVQHNDQLPNKQQVIPVNVPAQAPAAPVISPNGGRFSDSVQVTLTAEPDAQIRCTTDGTVPTADSPLYTGPITLTGSAAVQAIALRDGLASPVASAVFTKESSGGGGGGGGGGRPPKPAEPVKPPVPAVHFVDVHPDSYCYDAVQWAVSKKITLGTTETTFSPDLTCTRGQIVTFLWRAAGCPEPTGSASRFTDVSGSSFCATAVQWAVEQGITAGTTKTTFSPNAACTRGQAVTFLWRASGSPAAGAPDFADVAAGSFCASAVAWAVKEGITTGVTAAAFQPDASCTRGQIVTFLYRADRK